MKYKYQGANSSMKVAGITFAKDVEVELTAEQIKALKADRFGKAFLDDGTIAESKAKADDKAEAKTVKADSKTEK